MTTVLVLEFGSTHPLTGDPIWPPQRSTTVSVPGTVTTARNTVLVQVTADTDCRMGVNEPAQAYSTPILPEVPNYFFTGSGAGETLNFV